MKRLLFLDTETTGLQNPRLLQLGYAIGNHPPNVQIYRPPVGIDPAASEIHHITNEQADLYEPFEMVREQIQKLVGGYVFQFPPTIHVNKPIQDLFIVADCGRGQVLSASPIPKQKIRFS